MERFAREDVRWVLERYGIHSARRRTTTDQTEEMILIDAEDYNKTPIHELTLALMDVLPHKKVWVAILGDRSSPRPYGVPVPVDQVVVTEQDLRDTEPI